MSDPKQTEGEPSGVRSDAPLSIVTAARAVSAVSGVVAVAAALAGVLTPSVIRGLATLSEPVFALFPPLASVVVGTVAAWAARGRRRSAGADPAGAASVDRLIARVAHQRESFRKSAHALGRSDDLSAS